MKNVLLVLLVLPVLVQAQIEIGPKAGVSINEFYGKEHLVSWKARWGFSAGVTARKELGSNFSLSAGLQFDRAGSRLNDGTFLSPDGVTFVDGDLLYQCHYLTLPLRVDYSLGEKERFSLGAGMFGGWLLDATGKIKTKQGNTVESPEIDKGRRSFNFGLIAAATYRVPVGQRNILVLGFEDYLGLRSIGKPSPSKTKTHSSGLYLSFLWKLKK